MNNLQNEIFKDESKAREWLETRLWPHGAVCPHCGVENGATALNGEAHRTGLYQCNDCREQFTVTVGTVSSAPRLRLTSGSWLCS